MTSGFNFRFARHPSTVPEYHPASLLYAKRHVWGFRLSEFGADKKLRERSKSPSVTVQVPTVPMSVKNPVVTSMLYIETSFESEFVT
jgi:hypothetical protein